MPTGSAPPTPPAGHPDDAVDGEKADVPDLLQAFHEALGLAANPTASRKARSKVIRRLSTWMRPTWGLHRLVVEHIRARIALIDRHFARRLALGTAEPNDDRDRAALEQFLASLPPPRSKLWVALPLLAVVAVSQILLALLLNSLKKPPALPPGTVAADAKGTTLPKDVLDQITKAADLNPGNFTETLDTLLHSNPKTTALAIGLLTLSVYIVWRPLVPAFHLRRIILDMPRAIRGRVRGSELGDSAQHLGVHGRGVRREEIALFAALEMPPPRDAMPDVWVKMALVAILAALSVLMFVPPRDENYGFAFLTLAVLRLAWLAREVHMRTRRSDRTTPPAVGAAGAAEPPAAA